MSAFTQKSLDARGRAVTDSFSRKESSVSLPPRLADERPEAVTQLELDASLNRSAKVQSQLQLQQTLNQSPRVAAQMKLADVLNSRSDALPVNHPLQREGETEEEQEVLQGEFEPVQRQASAGEDEKPVQGKPEPVQKKENQTGLPDKLKAGVENLSGLAMDDVRVHYNSAKPATVQALAYTQGTEIHVGPGQEKHLAHEAWHVAQQKQGRVRPTMQAKGVAINDDAGLEKEADVMGERAAQAPIVMQAQRQAEASPRLVQAPPLLSLQPIQAKFVKLSEARIEYVQKAQKAAGEDVDAEYLQGLWETDTDQTAGEHGNPNPTLYIQVAKIAPRYVYNNPMAGDSPLVRLFAAVNQVEEAERREAAEDEDRNMLQILSEELPLYTLNEGGPYTPAQIKASIERQVGGQAGEYQINEILKSVLTGGVVEDTSQGGYGNIEFRFKDTEGDFYMESSYYEADALTIADTYPRLAPIPATQTEIDQFRQLYLSAGLPYAAERTGPNFVFIESSQADKFRTALIESGTVGGVQSRTPNLTATNPAAVARPLPAAPLAVPKLRARTYTTRAPRGSREGGQKGAMANYSAHDYVQQFNMAAAAAHSWEWLHIQGARLGGPNRPENLVAGTAEANTQMIPYERAIYRLSTVATPQKPADATWSATVKQDDTGANTQIGDRITMDVAFPQGEPPETEEVHPKEIKAVFPVTVNAVEGAEFTKLDRGIIEGRMKS